MSNIISEVIDSSIFSNSDYQIARPENEEKEALLGLLSPSPFKNSDLSDNLYDV